MVDVKPLTAEEFSSIRAILGERDFLIIHGERRGKAFCNSTFGPDTAMVIEKTKILMDRGGLKNVGYSKERS